MKFKNLFYIFGIVILFLIIYILYNGHFSEEAKIGMRNEISANKIKVGMKEKEVINIMGTPEAILQSGINKIYCYSSNNIDYLKIEIYIDTRGAVLRKFIPSN
ncbi:MAG: hypothetical protein KA797_00775 [Chitinophagales bacterium]|nr:hypothetical protein [Chitinophagales bacterium]